tara:strand:- start:1692 stop:2711 length:1020 start_codon:yes stop_codon:yes gene_type:complete
MARFVGLSINKGKQGGGGTITKTDPFTRASGITTDSSNNVTAVTLGDNSYSNITYNSDGLITEYTESIGGVDKIWELTYDSNNLVSTILEQIPSQPPGQALFTNPGTYSWTCPGGHTSVSAICVGAGGGGGGALVWKNNIPVTPGQSYTVVVGAPGIGGGAGIEGTSGGDSSFNWVSQSMTAQGGTGTASDSNNGTKGGRLGDYDGGGNGGVAGLHGYNGAGAGGYNGTGGTAPVGTGDESGASGSGAGGGGAWAYYAGGGVGLYGMTGQTGGDVSGDGEGGSGGQNGKGPGSDGQNSETGGDFGGGYSSRWSGNKGGRGAVRIMWGGGRSFPNNAGDV